MAGTFKGKYPGPDIFKGNKALNKTYSSQTKGKKLSEAAKKKIAQSVYSSSQKRTAAPKPAPKVTPKPAAPAPVGKPKTAYPTSNASSNLSGKIQLQSNAEIESALLDAKEQQRELESEATQTEQQSEISKLSDTEALRQQTWRDRGAASAANAYRGMRGASALRRQSDVEYQNTLGTNKIGENYRLGKANASGLRLKASNTRNNAEKIALRARHEYTNERSRLFPTQGSKAISSGVKKTVPTALSSKKNTVPKLGATTKKSTTSAKFKGKYPGPDIFKGNKALNTKYNTAIKGKKLTDAAKRKIAAQIKSGR